MSKCSVSSQVAPELVLKGICLGDYIGQPYEGLISRDYYDPEKPFDIHANVFTDDSIMSLAIYDACKSIKNTEFNSLNSYEIIPRAYAMFVRSMRYYVNMLPNAGYGPRFYTWAVNGAADYDSYANGGAMRSGVIGAFFDNIRDVIKYAIISAYATHKHPSGEKGAVLTAVCVWLAAHGASKDDIKAYVSSQCKDIYVVPNEENMKPEESFDINLTPADLKLRRARVLFGTATVSEAIINFLNSEDYIGCISNAMTYECDADTVAAISGGIAAAYYRNIPYIDDIILLKDDEKIPYEARFVMNRLSMF
jgi:ADP-ribosylglycohydrolase